MLYNKDVPINRLETRISRRISRHEGKGGRCSLTQLLFASNGWYALAVGYIATGTKSTTRTNTKSMIAESRALGDRFKNQTAFQRHRILVTMSATFARRTTQTSCETTQGMPSATNVSFEQRVATRDVVGRQCLAGVQWQPLFSHQGQTNNLRTCCDNASSTQLTPNSTNTRRNIENVASRAAGNGTRIRNLRDICCRNQVSIHILVNKCEFTRNTGGGTTAGAPTRTRVRPSRNECTTEILSRNPYR
jgi:hypothetical protein